MNLNTLGTVPSANHANSADTTINATNATNASNAANARNATHASNATNADHATHATTAGSAAISRLAYESATVTLSSTDSVTGHATCPNGLALVSGAQRVSDLGSDFVVSAFPVGRSEWQATAFGTDGNTMTVYAICAPAAMTTP